MSSADPFNRPLSNALKETTDQGLLLVKDHGIYLMSPAAENFIMSNDVNTVVYARGYKPTKANRDTLWDKTYAVSRDDFAEFVRLTPNMVRNVLRGSDITIELSETEMAVTA